MGGLTILSLCDYSGIWSRPYRDAGYDVQQIDLKHGQDVRFLEYPGKVHGILAAPPCTVFSAAGARWERSDEEMAEGLGLVDACLRIVLVSRPEWWVLENPVGTLGSYLGPPKFRFNPCDYGDPYTKKTCLWGRFCPPIPEFVSTRVVEPEEGSKMWSNYGGKSERTKEARSQTPAGFAQAFFEANP